MVLFINHKSSIINHQSSIISHQSLVVNYKILIVNNNLFSLWWWKITSKSLTFSCYKLVCSILKRLLYKRTLRY